jgi:hypothetical protein
MKRNSTTLRAVLLAGIAGGTAEVLWVTLYGWVTATSGAAVAREITASFWPAAAEWAFAPALGITIHMALALALAALIVPPLLRYAAQRPGPGAIVVGAVSVLALVWVVNFFLILPLVNPSFIALMPYGATLVSKVLFGVAAGTTL